MKPKAQIVNLPVYQPGKPVDEVKRQYGLTEVVKLASNENPYGCSPKVKEAIMSELEHTQIYPDGAAVELTTALSQYLNVQPNQLILGAGSDEIILMICRAYLQAGDETVMANPTFSQYKHNATIEGAISVEVPLIDGKHDLPAMLAAINEKTKIVWVCNPNNPTGTMLTHDEVASFITAVPAHIMIILDEAYIEYTEGTDFPRSLEFLQAHPNVVILRTFSKAYGLASLRIGYGIGQPGIIHSINQVRGPFNTTRYAQAAARAALADQAFIQDCAAKNREGIAYLTSEFERLGLSWFPAYGNFIMVETGRPAKEMFEALMKEGVIVRGGHALGYPTKLRVTVGSLQENRVFIAALEKVLNEVGAVTS